MEMQSYNEATSEFGSKSSIVQKNAWMKGKENGLLAPTGLQPDKQKPSLEKLQDPPKSRLPILSKNKEHLDFQKLHQSWQNQFQKGKAEKKKPCTRPQPFNFSQRKDRSQVTTDTGQSVNLQASHRRREPLSEVTLDRKNQESKDAVVKEFKADPVALASILSNVGVPIAATGKLSLAQRVPMKVSSITQSSNICKNMMVRSSMYAVLRSQSASSNLDRISCFSKMQTKVNDHKPVFKRNPLFKSHVPDGNFKEPAASNLNDQLQSQENPVLQQMNQTAHTQDSKVTSPLLRSQEVTTVKSITVAEDGESSVLPTARWEVNKSEVDSSAWKMDPMKNANPTSVEFVADSQALASIVSNTGVTLGDFGKVSLAQRVPVQAKTLSGKSAMTPLDTVVMQDATPKPSFGRMSSMAVPLKDVVFSPCRVPKTSDKSSGSAMRVHQLTSSAMKCSQRFSVTSKQPFFPKTPRALALEMANKKLEADLSDTQPTARSTVKWADELSPSLSETLCENEPKIEQVAVRLFLDAECPDETDNEKEITEESDQLKVSGSRTTIAKNRMVATLPEDSNNIGVPALAGVSQDLTVQANMNPPAPLSFSGTADLPVQCPSMVSGVKTSLPLSFLSHPAVQALQSRTLGPYSLPDIARLRIQATVSAKHRFWETCLDEECAFYTSRGAVSSYRSCRDPVSRFLERQDDLHFTPIVPEKP